MFNFKEAFTYLFQEKKWGLKFVIPYVVQVILLVITGLQTMVAPSYTYTYPYGTLGQKMPVTNLSYAGNNGVLWLVICLILIFLVPFLVVTLWYYYENVQAGIQKRKTIGIWENKPEDTLKKVGKYFLASLIYGIIILVIVGIFAGVLCCCLYLFMMIAMGGLSGQTSSGSMLGLGLSATLLTVCLGIIIGIITEVLLYIFVLPALLRLIATNTFNEAMKFQENFELSKKYFKEFMAAFLILFLYLVLTLPFSIGLGFIVALVKVNISPFFGFIIQIAGGSLIAIVTVYFSSFVYTRLLGQMFRNIIKKEPTLSYIKLEEK